jgi:DNA modification methylase
MAPAYKIHIGDNRQTLKTLPDNSIDSIVTDPPYELGFMGKKWDGSGIAFDVGMWKECLRVLKPGGHLLAFSGTRTQHRMVVAIEDAGFEIRDQIGWAYGSGFPKSLNIGKAIDKEAGAEREVVSVSLNGDRNGSVTAGGSIAGGSQGGYNLGVEAPITAPATEAAKKWDGWGTALKPAWEPICVARKPLEKGKTVAGNVLAHGTGGINVDGCRIGHTVETWPKSRSYAPGQMQPGHEGSTQETGDAPKGRWPANLIHDGSEEVTRLFPETKSGSGVRRVRRPNPTGKQNTYNGGGGADDAEYAGDSGSAARFFYCAKASKRDRDEGLDGFVERCPGRHAGTSGQESMRRNSHPTVKPTDLMRYLCRLVTPPGGTVLDPFTGSGSTGKAAVLEGFSFIGCELSEEYAAIAYARIDWADEYGDEETRKGKGEPEQFELPLKE